MRKICSLYLLFLFMSFIGFTYETILAIILKFDDLDRGFLSLPLCPIYGSGVILTYLLFDIPKNMRILKYKIKSNYKIKVYLYILFSAIIATILELIIGTFFEQKFNIVLWAYGNDMLTFNRYCALIPSLFWGISITIFMSSFFTKIYNKIYNFKLENIYSISITFTIFILLDLINIIFINV